MTTRMEIEGMQLQAKGHQKSLENQQKLGRGKERFPLQASGVRQPEDTLIVDFTGPELWNDTFLLFKAPKFVAVLLSQPEETNTVPILQIKKFRRPKTHPKSHM